MNKIINIASHVLCTCLLVAALPAVAVLAALVHHHGYGRNDRGRS